jgi:hypothetical protein
MPAPAAPSPQGQPPRAVRMAAFKLEVGALPVACQWVTTEVMKHARTVTARARPRRGVQRAGRPRPLPGRPVAVAVACHSLSE